MGAAACWHLARKGIKVLGLEQFEISHTLGSHHGQSRIIRKSYYEHPDYVPLLQRAYHNWNLLEKSTGSRVFEKTGLLYFGLPNSTVIQGVLKASKEHGIFVESLDTSTIKSRYPGFQIPEDYLGLWEPEAGFLRPEASIKALVKDAEKNGADIHTNTCVQDWVIKEGKVQVTTDSGVYTADKLVITSGAWTSKLVPIMGAGLQVTRQTMAWVKPQNSEPFLQGRFPSWLIDDPKQGAYYGFPVGVDGPPGMKLARHVPGTVADPDQVNRNITDRDYQEIQYALDQFFPEARATVGTIKTCLYTNSKDHDFIIDFLPDCDQRVVLACGFSGHGFKFAAVVGEIVSDLAFRGSSSLPIDFLRLGRS